MQLEDLAEQNLACLWWDVKIPAKSKKAKAKKRGGLGVECILWSVLLVRPLIGRSVNLLIVGSGRQSVSEFNSPSVHWCTAQ